MSKEAIASFRTALEIEPGNAYAERNLAASLGNAGFPEDAAGHFRRAVAPRANDQAAILGWAQAVESLGRFDEASEIYTKSPGGARKSALPSLTLPWPSESRSRLWRRASSSRARR